MGAGFKTRGWGRRSGGGGKGVARVGGGKTPRVKIIPRLILLIRGFIHPPKVRRKKGGPFLGKRGALG